MLQPPGFYYVKKTKRFVISSSDKSSERNLSCFFDICAIHVIFNTWRSVEIVVELGIFVMFLIFSWKKIRSKIIQITLIELWSFISFELRHVNSMKMSQKAKFGCSIFQLKIKRKQIFQVRHQFGHFIKHRIWHEWHKKWFQAAFWHNFSFLWYWVWSSFASIYGPILGSFY